MLLFFDAGTRNTNVVNNLTPSNSRNQSPRPVNGETTRLRPGATARNNNNRNSANLSSSTLQEDLMKLINPDYMNENIDENPHENEPKTLQDSLVSRLKCRSRENINGNNQTEVIFTTARPATVISNASTASSPAPSEKKLIKDERNSPSSPIVHQVLPSLKKHNNYSLTPDVLPLPDAGDMDWPSLVDTATRAMLHVREDNDNLNADVCMTETVRNGENLGHWVDDVAERLGLDASLAST